MANIDLPRHPFVIDVPAGLNPPTDFSSLVTHLMTNMNRENGRINQHQLRQCLGMASSYLLTDTSTSQSGFKSWSTGFCHIVDVMAALEALGELEKDTVDEASKACSECWGIASSYKGMAYAKEGVRAVAMKLKNLLDENGQTYHGQKIYSASKAV